MDAQNAMEILRNAAHLQHVDEEQLKLLSNRATWLSLQSQESILVQGHRHSDVYVLVHGKLRYHVKDRSDRIIAQGYLYPGDIAGDISAFNESESVASVFSSRPCQVIKIDLELFRNTILSCSQAVNSIAQKLISHASNALQKDRRRRVRESIAIVPLDDCVPIDAFMADLASSLNKFGVTGVVTKSIAENSLGLNFTDDVPDEQVYQQNYQTISNFIRSHDFVLFQAESLLSNWNKTVFKEVDRILLLTNSRGATFDVLLQEHLLTVQQQMESKIEVVFLQNDEAPKGSKEFLKGMCATSHHHVWLDRKPTVDRIARIVSGNSVGLALGGGGARAAAHVGLIRALEEAGIPIDFIGGTSIGAFIGALYAGGLDASAIEDVLMKNVVGTKLFNDYTMPIVSIVRGSKVSDLFQGIFGDRDIEDLPISFFATAVNITSTNLEIIDEGKIWEAIRASSSLPAILPPFPHSKGLLVDGGLLDNVPGLPMLARGCDFVIACDVGGIANSKIDDGIIQLSDNLGRSPPLWRFIKNRFSSKRVLYPRIPDIVTRCMLVGSKEQSQKTIDNADIYVRMPVEKWGLFEFDSAKELIRVGYDYARKESEQWHRKWSAKSVFRG